MYDLIIIGGGPAAVAAGVYAARKKLKTLLITEAFGGQSLVSAGVENWIGTKSVSGYDLAQMLEEHLRSYQNVEIKMPEKVVAVREIKAADPKRPHDFEVETDNGGKYHTKTIILASGARRRRLGIPGEDTFDGKGVAFCATCLPPHELVIANSSARSISTIKHAERVLTGSGSFQKVAAVMEREYDGDLIEIRTRFFSEPVQLTPNHPVLTTTVTHGSGKTYWRDFTIHEPRWLPAGQLTRDHVLLYPRILGAQDRNTIRISDTLSYPRQGAMMTYRKGSPTAIKIPNKIRVDNDFVRLAGYFIAEGSITDRGVNFYFSKREGDLGADVVRIVQKHFGLNARRKVEGNVLRVEIYSEIVRDLFEVFFGKYAHNKAVPHWMVLLPTKKIGELVKGIYRGDGCKRKKDFCIVTNSRNLAYQLRDILLRLGIVPAIQRRDRDDLNLKPGKIGNRLIRFNHDKFHIVIGGPSLVRMSEVLGIPHEKIESRNRTCHHAWLDKRYLYLPIRSLDRRPYRGKVHNLAVEQDGTYIAKNFIVHNCDAPIFSGKRVAVVGGGNAGLESVVDLFPYASEIYLLHRGGQLKGDAVTQEEIRKNSKVKIILNAEPQEILGDGVVTGLRYKDNTTGEVKEIEIEGLFVEIGAIPNSEFVKGLVDMNELGEVLINHRTAKTSKSGIFAAGDVTDEAFKQNNISAGDAVKAALSAYNYLMGLPTKGEKLPS